MSAGPGLVPVGAIAQPICLRARRGLLDQTSRSISGLRRLCRAGPIMPNMAPTPKRSAPASLLPLTRLPLVGRERETADIAGLLADPACRLVTLVGPGGIGKTRLATSTAWSQQRLFEDGTHFVA